ncbi:MAG: histidine kinase [Gammaproteobacteria bacterium]|nr:histidine kinase [Gammaproteobacteria bacterium]
MLSLNARLFISASLALSLVLGLTGWALDKVFIEHVENTMKEKLQSHIYALIAATDMGKNGRMYMPASLPETRFSEANSGLYAQIISHDREQIWRSSSLGKKELPFKIDLKKGEDKFEQLSTPLQETLYIYNLGLAWNLHGKEEAFTFSIAEDTSSMRSQIEKFRKYLWGWLGGVSFVLLMLQGSILRWGLTPLRQVEANLHAIESGTKSMLEERQPKELRGLTRNLNALITSERVHLDRYRNSLSDLAHSLKTPLAVIQSEIDNHPLPSIFKETLSDQVERIRQHIDYQLQRAATSGRTALIAPVSINTEIDRITQSLKKVYAEKNLRIKISIADHTVFNCDQGDFLEASGNIIENAFKWATSEVLIFASVFSGDNEHNMRFILVVEDDGPGIKDEMKSLVLKRGMRADEHVQGQGIGLAVVHNIAKMYDGHLEIQTSDTGGTKIKLTLHG